MSTTTTKAQLIARLVLGGKGTPRALRDRKHAELTAMVEAMEAEARADLATIGTLSVAEVAAQEGVTKAAVRRWVRVGHLRNVAAESQGRDFRIDAAEPRTEEFRTSAAYAGYCREVSNALAPSYAGQSGS